MLVVSFQRLGAQVMYPKYLRRTNPESIKTNQFGLAINVHVPAILAINNLKCLPARPRVMAPLHNRGVELLRGQAMHSGRKKPEKMLTKCNFDGRSGKRAQKCIIVPPVTTWVGCADLQYGGLLL